MKTVRRRSALIFAAALALIGFAMWLRYAARQDFPLPFLNMYRSIIYIAMAAAWGVSLWFRIVQAQARRYLMAASALMVLWLVLRTVKFSLDSITAARYLWYFYYLPMLGIPLMVLFVSMTLGRPENYRLPRKMLLLYIPAAALLLLVLTNDLHQLVFSFPGEVMTDAMPYEYGAGYYAVVGWELLCALAAFLIMLFKCHIPHSRKYLCLPLVPMALAVAYCCAYVEGVHWVWVVAGDITVSQCIMFAGILESCIQCGLISSNSGYGALFEATTIRVQITDASLQTRFRAAGIADVPPDVLRRAVGGAAMLDGHTYLKSHPLRRGYVFWQEDVAELAAVTRQLESTQSELREAGDILRAEQEQSARFLRLKEQNRLYDLIEQRTAPQLALLGAWLGELQQTDDLTAARALLGKIAVVGTYVKRCSNLVFVAGSRGAVESAELQLCLNESAANLTLCGASCRASVEAEGALAPAVAERIYDLFEAVVEAGLGTLTQLLLYAGYEGGRLAVHISAACPADLAQLKSRFPGLSAERDDDGIWCLSDLPEEGGDAA